jgi:LysM repeat protein
MDDRSPSDGRSRGVGSKDRPSRRRGYAFPRADHRHSGSYGSQARRDTRQGAYIIGFVVVVAALAGFLYVGLNWATGPGRAAALATQPTVTPIVVAPPAPPPEPSPTVGEQTYVVQNGDYPEKIAQKFGIKTDELIAANNIDDPQKLQIGQALKIPAPSRGH